MSGDDRGSAYWGVDDDGNNRAIFRASGLGAACEQSLVRHLIGQPTAPPPEWMLRKFEEGNVAEQQIIDMLDEQYGWKIGSRELLEQFGTINRTGQIRTEWGVGRHIVRCHPDGIVVKMDRGNRVEAGKHGWSTGDLAVLECKAFARSTFDKWLKQGLDVIAVYPWQVAVEMLTTKLPCLYVVGLKDEDGMVESIHLRWYDVPPRSELDIMRKVLRVVKAAEACGAGAEVAACAESQFPCAFYQLDGAACNSDNKPERPDGGDEVAALAERYLTGKQMMETAKKGLLERVTESCVAGGFSVSYTPPAERGNVSWKGVAEKLRPADDGEWEQMQDDNRGKPAAASVTVKAVE